MSEIELKNCPFCGGEAEVDTHHHSEYGYTTYTVYCNENNCWVSPQTTNSESIVENAIEHWNTRPLETQQSALLAKAVEALKFTCSYAESGLSSISYNSPTPRHMTVDDWFKKLDEDEERLEQIKQMLAEITKGD